MRVTAQRKLEKSRRKPTKAEPKRPEDFILSMVIDRLRVMVGARYEDIEEWTAAQGMRIPSSSICGMSGGEATKYPYRVPLLARYFREAHGLDYVDCNYLHEGTEREWRFVEVENSIRNQSQDIPEALPLFEFADKETA